MGRRTKTAREIHDAEIIANATYFTACRKIGPARYDTRRASTLDEARQLASLMGGRVMLYAVRNDSGIAQSAHVENVYNE